MVGFVRCGNTGTLIVDGIPDGNLDVGGDPIYGPTSFKLSSPGQSFAGLMVEVKLFDRALDTPEIANEYWQRAKQFGKDMSRRGNLTIRPHIYDADKQALFEIDTFGAMPLAQDERLLLELLAPGRLNSASPRSPGPTPNMPWWNRPWISPSCLLEVTRSRQKSHPATACGQNQQRPSTGQLEPSLHPHQQTGLPHRYQCLAKRLTVSANITPGGWTATSWPIASRYPSNRPSPSPTPRP